jgi:hypothetical protein
VPTFTRCGMAAMLDGRSPDAVHDQNIRRHQMNVTKRQTDSAPQGVWRQRGP